MALFDELCSGALKFPGEKSKHSKMCFPCRQDFPAYLAFSSVVKAFDNRPG